MDQFDLFLEDTQEHLNQLKAQPAFALLLSFVEEQIERCRDELERIDTREGMCLYLRGKLSVYRELQDISGVLLEYKRELAELAQEKNDDNGK